MKRQVPINSIARMLGKYSKGNATREAMQASSQLNVETAVSAAKALIPLSSRSGFYLSSLHRLGYETWIECETVNCRLRAGLKRCCAPVQKLFKK